MKKVLFYILITVFVYNINAQIDAGNLLGLPTATDFTEISGIVGPQIGALVYNLDDDEIYRFTSTGWQIFDSDNIYNTDGTLTGNRTVTMGANSLQFDIDYPTNSDARTALTLRRSNDNNNEIGIAFRNSGNAYDAGIVLSGPNGGGTDKTAGSLVFYTGGNDGTMTNVSETLNLLDNNQIRFSAYGLGTPNFLNNSPARFLGVESDGDIVEVDASAIGSDDQLDSEVDLDTPIDVDEGGIVSPTNETTVQEVIQAIAPITSKAGRVFYPPSIQIDASANGTFTVNLYDEYVAQHTGAGIVRSISGGVSAPDIPIYNADELYYYVTFADPGVFGTISIDGDTGEMTYQIVGQPTDFNSLINVVFVVK